MIVRDYNLPAIFLFSLSHETQYTRTEHEMVALFQTEWRLLY